MTRTYGRREKLTVAAFRLVRLHRATVPDLNLPHVLEYIHGERDIGDMSQ